MNKVMLIGNLGDDPKVTYLESGGVIAKFPIATTARYKNKQGEYVDSTEWHNIVCWNKKAEVAEKYFKKGMKLFVEGRIKTDKYEKDGQTKYFTNIDLFNFEFLDSKGSAESQQAHQSSQNLGQDDDDLPF